MISPGGRTAGALVGALPPSRERLAAGVSGGECTADVGGDGLGVASTDPEANRREGVAEPEGTCLRRRAVSFLSHDHVIAR